MYGNDVYGSIPYGDVELVSITVLLDKRTLAVIFISKAKGNLDFISERKQTTFRSQEFDGRRN